jgi:hypothetical protein
MRTSVSNCPPDESNQYTLYHTHTLNVKESIPGANYPDRYSYVDSLLLGYILRKGDYLTSGYGRFYYTLRHPQLKCFLHYGVFSHGGSS